MVFCFSGQGSQYYGMAADLMAEDAVFRHWMQSGDAIVARRHGFSVLAEMQGPGHPTSAPFDRMEASHPAIFLVQYALAKVLQHHRLRPDMLFGVSLGEFTAQTVAGMMPFEASLCAVADQPALFRRTCRPGCMVAVLASPDLYQGNRLLAECGEIAGINSDGHFILSAPAEHLPSIESVLAEHAVPFQRLPVPFAFHSRFIDDAETAWRDAFGDLRRETAFWPVWSACMGGVIGPATPDLPWRIVRQTMNVRETLRRLERLGGAVYVDLSPSGTLAALFRQEINVKSPSQLVQILSPFGGNIQRLRNAIEMLLSQRNVTGDSSR